MEVIRAVEKLIFFSPATGFTGSTPVNFLRYAMAVAVCYNSWLHWGTDLDSTILDQTTVSK